MDESNIKYLTVFIYEKNLDTFLKYNLYYFLLKILQIYNFLLHM